MVGGVYPHGKNGWRVKFKGEWFTRDEHGRPFKAKFYALSFLNLLNALYDPDPGKNRYDPAKFKDKTPHKFDPAFEIYLKAKPLDSSYQKGKEYIWKKYLMPHFQNQDFRTIDKVQLDAFKIWLEGKRLKGHTIKNIFTVLHSFLNYYRSSFQIFPTWVDLKYQKPKIRWATNQELDQIFEFISEADKPYFWAIRGYGLRPEEASGLMKDAIIWQTEEILIKSVFVDGQIKNRTKSLTERIIPIAIDPDAMRYLRMAYESSQNSMFVFTTQQRIYTRHIRERRWKRAMDQAKQKYETRWMTLRDLRHSAATRWRNQRVPLDLISRLLGHSTQKTTEDFYADVDLHKVVEMVTKR